MSDKIAIRLDAVKKSFKLPHERHSSVKSLFVNVFRTKRTFEKQHVLKGISFDIKEGEFFGITGRNGSGKSTLLKLLAGIYTPDGGSVDVRGTLTPFIELGVGFNPELTGRENVFLNGALLGFSRQEMQEMYDDIVSFAELEKFMDQKLKNYSSGMQVRLAFSIAIRAESDILLIDEVLAVGDANFQNKCIAIFEEIKKRGTTVVFVSHDMESVRRFCDRAALIENGELMKLGPAQTVIDEYLELNAPKTEKKKNTPFGVSDVTTKDTSKVSIVGTTVVYDGKKNPRVVGPGTYCVDVAVKFKDECTDIVPGVVVRNQSGIRVTASNTEWVNVASPRFKKGDTATFRFTFMNVLERGTYFVSTNAVSGTTRQFYDWDNDAVSFKVSHKPATGGVVNPDYSVSVLGKS